MEALYISHQRELSRRSSRKYYEKNRELLIKKSTIYNQTHREAASIADKKYRNANKDKINQYRLDYYQTNKEVIKAKQNSKIKCECGRIVSKSGISGHRKSKVHLSAMAETDIAQTPQ
jgi:hypothetical protein